MIFLSCVIMLLSKLSLVIGLTRRDIVDMDRLAHVIFLDQIKQRISEAMDMICSELLVDFC